MKLVTYAFDGSERPGAVLEDEVVDLSSAVNGAGSSVRDLLEAGEAGLEKARSLVGSGSHRLALGDVTLRAPVRPNKFFAIGLNYADHVAEAGLETPRNLTVLFKAPSSIAGPYDSIERPAVSSFLDYEGELGVVIGQRCRHVRAEDAEKVIAGYLVVNDVSVRDWQVMTPQWSLGKSFDTHGPIGPYLVTGDEVGDPHTLNLRTTVNGEQRQSSNTSNLIFNCFQIVEILSQACTLQPGDVIATGTPSGVAANLEGRPWLAAGDQVRVEIERLGAIENVVVAEEVARDFVLKPEWVQGR